MALTFENEITTQEELRGLLGEPTERTKAKAADHIDAAFARFITASPFLLVASRDAHGGLDVSPRGDPAGFVAVLDEKTLAIPDRPGNRRGDTFENLLVDPHVGLIFLVPGHGGTLRVKGRGRMVRDADLCTRLGHDGRPAQLVLVVEVDSAMLHCPKCMIRSSFWEPDGWPSLEGVPSSAEMMAVRAGAGALVEDMEAVLEESVRDRLY